MGLNNDAFLTVFLLFGISLVLIAGIPSLQSPHVSIGTMSGRRRALLVLSGVCIVAAACYLHINESSRPISAGPVKDQVKVTGTIKKYKAKGVDSTDWNQIVRHIDQIDGTIQELHDSHKLWAYVHTDRYFLLKPKIFNDGTWEIDNVTFGSDNDSRKHFEFGIFAIDLEGNTLLDNVKTDNNSDHVVYYLPCGAIKLDSKPATRL